ncbi:MAG: hypothetical protein NTU80_08325 [Verrucomicrobia bacterium]|nr:hypothetical protein [Verrucomicrobiota bacterium]
MKNILFLILTAFSTVSATAILVPTPDVIYQGIGQTYNGLRLFIDGNDLAGIRINTGSNGYLLSSVQLVLSDDQGGPADPNGTPQITVYGVSATPFLPPNSSDFIGSFGYSSTLQPWASLTKVVELQPVSSIILQANTDYWFLVSLVSGSKLVMKSTSNPLGVVNQNIIGNSDNGFGSFNVSSSGYQMNILATPIPEPATASLLLGCFAFLTVLRRRRKL